MSIKCLTVVLDDDGNDICVLARSDNGDLNGHGEELKQFLRGFAIVRDLKVKDRRSVATNMGHLACVLVRFIRTNLGLVELLASGTRGIDEEYIYTIYPRHAAELFPSLLNLRVEAAFPPYGEIDGLSSSKMTVIYDGLLDEFNPHQVQLTWEHASDTIHTQVGVHAMAANSAMAG
jgi:hypothetical protein